MRTKGSCFRALFLRLKARRGPKGHRGGGGTILTAVSFMLKRGVDDHDLGPDHFQRTERTRLAARLARRLDELGFEVTLAERAAALGRLARRVHALVAGAPLARDDAPCTGPGT